MGVEEPLNNQTLMTHGNEVQKESLAATDRTIAVLADTKDVRL